MGAAVINAGALTLNGMEVKPDDTASRLMEAYRDPSSCMTDLQQNVFLTRVIQVRKYFKYVKEGDSVPDEMRVFRERGLDRFVLIKEAIDNIHRPC